MRKWRENEAIKRKWREYEEIERKWRKSDEMELTHHESLQSSYISKYYGHRLGMSSGQSETGIGYVEAHQNTTPRKRARSLKIYVSVFKNVVSAELDTK